MNVLPYRFCRRPCRAGRRAGFTLVELSVSIVSTSFLLAGIASSIFIATTAASSNNASNSLMTTSLAATQLISELVEAKSFSERTSTAITFTVADRDGNLADETIRYTWNGLAGSPLLRAYNGTSATSAENVHSFNLAYTSQSSYVKKKILFVRGNVTGTQATYDRTRRDLLHGWGYQVLPLIITASMTQTEINSYLSAVDGVYVSSTVNESSVGTKLNAATVGIVLEKAQLFHVMKLHDYPGIPVTDCEIRILINTHPVTSAFSTSTITLLNTDQIMINFDDDDDLAPGAIVLGKPRSGSDPTLVAVEKGGTLANGTAAPGRRLALPWGGFNFDPAVLNTNGQTLCKAALKWAASEELATGVDITMQVGASSNARLQTRVEVFGKPPL